MDGGAGVNNKNDLFLHYIFLLFLWGLYMMQAESETKGDSMAEKLVSAQARIPESWSDLLKEEAKKSIPPKTREALIFRLIEREVNRIKRKEIK